nr:PREDICTED: uncharacterized protein LOC107130350 [Macaca fascicularis]
MHTSAFQNRPQLFLLLWKKLISGNPFWSSWMKRKEGEMLLITSVLVLWMQLSQVNGQQIMQIPQYQHVQEGEDFTTYCNSSTTLSNIQWYKQRPGGHPVFLIMLVKSGEVKKQKRLTFQSGEAKKNSSLHITATQTTDVGTYFCAGHSAPQAPAVCLQILPWVFRSRSSYSPQRAGARESQSHNVCEDIEQLLPTAGGMHIENHSVKTWKRLAVLFPKT